MKKILIAATIVFIIILLIFFWLLNRGKNTDEIGRSPTISFDDAKQNKGGNKGITPSRTTNPTLPSSSNLVAPTSSYKYSLFQRLRLLAPYSSNDFDISYSQDLKKYLITKKTPNADAAIASWALANNISGLFTSVNGVNEYEGIFLVRDMSQSSANTNFTNKASQAVPVFQRQILENLKRSAQTNANTNSSLSISNAYMVNTDSLSVSYSTELDTFVVEKKNNNADRDLRAWAEENNVTDLVEDVDLFVPVNGAPISFEDKVLVQLTPTGYSNPYVDTYEKLRDVFSIIPTAEPTVPIVQSTPKPGQNTSLPVTNLNIDILDLIKSYGLPNPTADTFNGANGYNNLRSKLTDARASWAAKELLNAERVYESKNPTGAGLPKVNRYLTTAWLWLENGASSWPDPYMMNCNDDRSGYLSEVSFFCNVNNFQVAGYQAAARRNDYARVFNFLYSENQLQERIQQVLSNDNKASREKWKYSSSSQQKGLVSAFKNNVSQATINDISSNKPFSDQKTQFLTLALGKDPGMVIGLNTFAVSEGDLIRGIKSGNCFYTSYCGTHKQLLSNMIAALYLFDTGSRDLAAPTSVPPDVAAPPSSEYVYYAQCGSTYSSHAVGGGCNICDSGCGPSAVAMILSSYISESYNPIYVVDNLYKGKYYLACDGSIPGEGARILKNRGLQVNDNLIGSRYLNKQEAAAKMLQWSKAGWTFFALANYCSGGCGHFFWITQVDDNGRIWAYDSYYGRNSKPPLLENKYNLTFKAIYPVKKL